ncbi:hypothetical protein ACFVSU_20170 [Microbacterium sp. NPDC058062]|uniref:hypothetical protein n=1 Tax=Microbacterium sp. NPDC058062 TaxID=3346320 RepID=UPI0036DC5799
MLRPWVAASVSGRGNPNARQVRTTWDARGGRMELIVIGQRAGGAQSARGDRETPEVSPGVEVYSFIFG